MIQEKELKTLLRLSQDKNKLLCCDGRIGGANLSFHVKHTYISDKNHYFTKLIIAYFHELVKHHGVTIK